MAVVVGGRAERLEMGRGCGCRGCRVCGDGGLVVLVEERRGVECEGRCCCGASREEEQLVYHDADFGG